MATTSTPEEPKIGMPPASIIDSTGTPRWENLGSMTGVSGKSGYGSGTSALKYAVKHKERCAGKLAVVTGASPGSIGAATAAAFAAASCEVVLVMRNLEKAATTTKDITSKFPDAKVSSMACDLSSLDSVHSFGKEWAAKYSGQALHFLINNAAVMAKPYALSKDGQEMQFATGHLGHFLITHYLLPNLVLAEGEQGARIINLSSLGHRFIKPFEKETIFDPQVYNSKDKYEAWSAYGRVKLANVVFTCGLEKFFKEQGIGNVHAYSVHPGAVETNLADHLSIAWLVKNPIAKMTIGSLMGLKNPDQGASTSMYAALSPDLDSHPAAYLVNCNLSVHHPWGSDAQVIEQLWTVSEKITGVSFYKS